MPRAKLALVILILGGLALWTSPAPALAAGAGQESRLVLQPVGEVQKADGRTTLVIRQEFAPALLGLKAGAQIWVIYWFHRNDTQRGRSVLQVHPRHNPSNPLTGVFACRSPFRPNLIGLSLCKVLWIEGNLVRVDKIDAFADTPILDIKPYAPGIDSP